MENTRRIQLTLNTNDKMFDTDFVLSSADDVLFCSQETVKSFLFDLMIPGCHEANDLIMDSFGAFLELYSDEYGTKVISFTETFVKLFKGILSCDEGYPEGIALAWYQIFDRFNKTYYKASLLACINDLFGENSSETSFELSDFIDVGDAKVMERLRSDVEYANAHRDMRNPNVPHAEALK